MSVVVGDQREGQIYAGGDAGGGPHVAVLDVDGVRFHRNVGVGGIQLAAICPVGGRPPPLEQAQIVAANLSGSVGAPA